MHRHKPPQFSNLTPTRLSVKISDLLIIPLELAINTNLTDFLIHFFPFDLFPFLPHIMAQNRHQDTQPKDEKPSFYHADNCVISPYSRKAFLGDIRQEKTGKG